MATPKYNFSSSNGQLVVELDNLSLQWANSDTSSYRASSINLFDSRKIYLYDFGELEREFEFANIGTIDGSTPSNIQNAYDLLSALIPDESGGGSPVTGTERQVIGFDSSGNAQAVTIGWKQLSDLPTPPPFLNGVYTGTAFQSDGSALFAFLELGIDADEPTSIAKPNTIPMYQPGTIGTGGGTLPVQDPVEDLDAVNKRSLESIMDVGETTFVLDGTTTIFDIPHGLGSIPKSISVTFSDATNLNFTQSIRTRDITKIRFTCTDAPAIGSQTVYWQVYK